MSALVKLLTNNYMGLQKHEYTTTNDGFGLRLEASDEALVLGGPEHGKEISLSEPIKAGTTVQLKPRLPVAPRKYTLITSYNLSLFRDRATVTIPPVINPGNTRDIRLVITAHEDILISPDDYVFEFYLID